MTILSSTASSKTAEQQHHFHLQHYVGYIWYHSTSANIAYFSYLIRERKYEECKHPKHLYLLSFLHSQFLIASPTPEEKTLPSFVAIVKHSKAWEVKWSIGDS